MIYSFDKISISYYDSPESLIEEFNLEVKGVLDSGFRYLYSELANAGYSYQELGHEKSPEIMESRFLVRTLLLSDKPSSGRGIESIVAKIYVKDIDYGYDGGPSLQEVIDSFCVENGYGYVPASAGSNASVINKEESEPFAVLENGRWVTYHRAKKRQATCVIYIKYSKDSLQKKSGWALVKYEEVDAPE